ncbi:chaperone NapD [Helicobacter sp. 11S03491-1]|uniref:chaperone NapD n=1 Tax=Helicobacter sp. 11S03491-1 TaxID=1476196 RepID=UPI000BA79863|nr:chaperone NapD [Helicobacter sp. 11S03491-1]PAF41116.1 hypothetical protein BKH45_08300 [Helicobacter sp. 11S03491-1]
MNISSIIIKVDSKYWDKVMMALGCIDGVEVSLCDLKVATIIAVISAQDVGKEIESLQKIEQIQGVLSAKMHYSYSEEEFEKPLQPHQLAQKIENIDAKNVRYRGSISSWLEKK